MKIQQRVLLTKLKISTFIFASFLLVASNINMYAAADDATDGVESFFNLLNRAGTAFVNNPAVQAIGTGIKNGAEAVATAMDRQMEAARATRDEKIAAANEELATKRRIINNGYQPIFNRWARNHWQEGALLYDPRATDEVRADAIGRALKAAEEHCNMQIKTAEDEYAASEKRANELRDGIQNIALNAAKEWTEAPTKIALAERQAIQNRKADVLKHEASLEWWSKTLQDKTVVRNVVLGLGSAALLVFAAKHGTHVLAKYVEAMIGKPKLVRETSRVSLYESLFGEQKVSRMGEFIVHPGQKAQLMEIAEAAKLANSRGDELSNVLLYGPPGTGKTMFAKALAHYAGLEYAMMSGSDFSQFKEGEDITQLHKLFDWAEASPKGLLVFVDEADAFLMERSFASTSEQSKKLTNAFLSRVEKPSSLKIMWVFATNHPDTIDSAIFSRVNDKVEFVLPAAQERYDIFVMNIKKYLHTKNITLAPEVEAAQVKFAEMLNGASGRDIEQCVINFVRSARTANTSIITLPIAEKVIETYMMEKAKQDARKKKRDILSGDSARG